jgi:SAM-dependent methyltransferase
MANSIQLSIDQWHQRFRQQASWTREIRRYLLNFALTDGPVKILEAGSGTGAILSGLNTEDLTVYGLDLNADFLQYSRRNAAPNARHTAGDIYHAPFLAGSFDLVVCHYLLLWLVDPVAALREIARIAKNGAWLLVFAEPDYGGRIDAPPPLDRLGQMQTRSLAAQGADPCVGRKLPGYINKVREIAIQEYGILSANPLPQSNPDFWESEWEMLAADLETLDEKDLNRYKEADQKARQAGERVLVVPTFYMAARIQKTGEKA